MENVICELVRDDTATTGISLKQFSIYLNMNMQIQICVFVCKYAGIIYTSNTVIYIILFYTIGIIFVHNILHYSFFTKCSSMSVFPGY